MLRELNSPVSRRRFIQGVTGLAGAAAISPLLAADPPMLIGSQLYGWGQYYAREQKPVDHDEIFSALRDAGYDYAEGSLDSAKPENNAKFADRLKSKGLRPVSLYTGGRLHEDGKWQPAVERMLAAARVCRESGFSVLVCNPDPIGRAKTEAELKQQATALKQLGEGLKVLGLRFGVHNHTPEMVNEAKEFHHNLRETPAGVVDFCFDVHWVYRGGVAPMDALRQYGKRVVTWHLRQSRDQIWWEDMAEGDVDYKAIAKNAKEQGCPALYTVELAIEKGTKITRSVVENHRRSREYVKAVFGV